MFDHLSLIGNILVPSVGFIQTFKVLNLLKNLLLKIPTVLPKATNVTSLIISGEPNYRWNFSYCN